MILHGIEYQRPTSLNMRIMADHVTYSFLAFMKSIFHFCLGCYCGGYSQNGRSNLSSWNWSTSVQVMACCLTVPSHYLNQCWLIVGEFLGIHLRAISKEELSTSNLLLVRKLIFWNCSHISQWPMSYVINVLKRYTHMTRWSSNTMIRPCNLMIQ